MATVPAEQPVTEVPAVLPEKSTEPLQTPLPSPTAASKTSGRPALTADQQAKYDWLLAQANTWTEVTSEKGKGGPLTDDERMWLTRECLLRYLRATKWQEKDSEKRVLDTLTWRRDYIAELTPEHVSPENETGKQVLLGYDDQCRPCLYLYPGRQNTDTSPRQVQHLVYMVERVLDLMPAQQETLALLINFQTTKTRKNTSVGISTGREVLGILQTHYPERLGRALIINIPWVVWGFFKLITPFIDPLTREKLKFNEDMKQYIPKEQLWTEFNGELKFEYDHSVYWPALTKLCAERREAKKQRWVAAGQLIGEHEDYLSGLTEKGATRPEPEVDTTPDVVAAKSGDDVLP